MLNTKIAYYLNERSVLYSMVCLNAAKEELVTYNVGDSLEYLLEMLNCRARENESVLTFCKNPGFPSELLGDKAKLETLLMELLMYLVNNTKNGEVCVTASMRHIDDSGRFVLGFDILTTKSENVSCEKLREMLNEENESGFCLYEVIIKCLNAVVKVFEKDEKNVKIAIEVPFNSPDDFLKFVVPKLNFYETVKINKYTVKWVPKKPAANIQANSSSVLKRYENALSPLLTSRGHEILNRRSQESSKQLAEQRRIREEVIARLKSSSGVKERGEQKKAPVSSFASGLNARQNNGLERESVEVAANNSLTMLNQLSPYAQREVLRNLKSIDLKSKENKKEEAKDASEPNQVVDYSKSKPANNTDEMEPVGDEHENAEYLYFPISTYSTGEDKQDHINPVRVSANSPLIGPRSPKCNLRPTSRFQRQPWSQQGAQHRQLLPLQSFFAGQFRPQAE